MQPKEMDGLKSIFDQIDELDKFLQIDDDDDVLGLGIDQEAEEFSIENHVGSRAGLSQSETGFSQSIDQIKNDFPGVVIGNFLTEEAAPLSKSVYVPPKTENVLTTEHEFADNVFWDLK